MSYYIHKFGDVYATAKVLPLGAGVQDVGVDPVRPRNIVLPGGGTFNTQGTGVGSQALPSGHVLVVRGAYKANTAAALQTLVDDMREYIGKYDKLWMYCGDTTQRWRYARLLDASMESDPNQFHGFWQPMELIFELDDMLWYGDTINSDTITLDASPKEGTINNAGKQVVRDITITVTAQGSAITQCDIANAATGYVTDMRFLGSLAATKALVIDCGEMTVKNDGTDAWDDWDRQATHTRNEWLCLVSGNNIITVTRTGGDNTSTCHLGFYDGFP